MANLAPNFITLGGIVTTDIDDGLDLPRAAMIDADGRILVAGTAVHGVSFQAEFAIVRYDVNGQLDTSFGIGGVVLTGFTGGATASDMVLQADGKIVVAGSASDSGSSDFAVARYNTDGTLDATFDGDGMATTLFPGGFAGANVVAMQGTRVLLAGAAFNGTDNDFALARYDADGALDATFGSGGTLTLPVSAADDVVTGIVVLSDNSIVVVGSSSSDSATSLARFTEDGVLDPTFGTLGVTTAVFGPDPEFTFDVALTPGGEFLVAGGGYNTVTSGYDFRLSRYTAAGALDTSFDADGYVLTDFDGGDDFARTITVQADGTIMLAGNSSIAGSSRMALARYAADGTLDGTFGAGGKVVTGADGMIDTGESLVLQTDGRIVLAGSVGGFVPDGPDIAVVRYEDDGTLDPTFATPVFVPFDFPVVLAPHVHVFDAELSAQGHYDGATFTLQRSAGANADDAFYATGYLDPLGTVGDDLVYTSPFGGPPMMVGTITANSGGTLAFTFNNQATQDIVDGVLQSLSYRNEGPVLPVSVDIEWLVSDNDASGALQATGVTTVTIDPNEAPAFFAAPPSIRTDFGGFSDVAAAIALAPDDSIVLAGMAFSGAVGVARYGANGSAETGFGTDGALITPVGFGFSQAADVVMQADGNIVVAGESFNGVDSDFTLVRYIGADGSLDPTFGVGGVVDTDFAATDDVGTSLVLLGDGSIVVAGYTGDFFDGDFALAKYDGSGLLDLSFGQDLDGDTLADGKTITDLGAADEAYSIALQDDGSFVLAGSTGFGFDGDVAVVRYDSTGQLDPLFAFGGTYTYDGGGDDFATVIKVQPLDQRIVIGGATQVVDSCGCGHYDFFLARLNTDGSPDTTFSGDGVVTTDFGAPNDDLAFDIAFDAAGRLLVAGLTFDGIEENLALARYDVDGSIDTSFGTGGKVITRVGPFDDEGLALAVQADGRIVVAGTSQSGLGDNDFVMVRYEADGSLDPTFNRARPVFVEGGPAVVLDSNPQLTDVELGDRGDYAGATLTLERYGGPHVQDVFSSTPDLDPLIAGNDLVYRGLTLGTVVQNSAGRLILSFTTTDAIEPLVNGVLRSIEYANTSTNPDASVTLDYAFSDGNTGDQGPGGPLTGFHRVTVTLEGVNSEPTFVTGRHETLLTGLSRVAPHWASAISAGPGDESSQALSFLVGNDNPGLFSVLPAISTDGTLTYSIAPGATGTATVTVSIQDDGGTANGGVDTSAPRTFAITAVAANPIAGGAEPHTLIGGPGADTLNAGPDGDCLIGDDGADALNGGSGLDFARYDSSPTGVLANLARPSQNTGHALGDTYSSIEGVVGSLFDDTLVGNNNPNELRGLDGDDYLQARGAIDTLLGGDGIDRLEGGGGGDHLDGGEGLDYAKYSYALAAVHVDLADAAFNTGDAAGDSFISVEGLIGSRFDDNLFGDGNRNDIAAAGGNDTVDGRGGDDNLQGMDGDDVLTGGPGEDRLTGGAGIDFASYETAAGGVLANLAGAQQNTGEAVGDRYLSIEGLIGSAFRDTLVGDGNANTLRGLDGDDYLQARGGDDTLVGGNGNDQLEGGAGADDLQGGSGFDYAKYKLAASGVTVNLTAPALNLGEAASDTFDSIEGAMGSSFADFLIGDFARNDLVGLEGDDDLRGLGGNDVLQGGSGSDLLDGGAGADRITGGADGDNFVLVRGEAHGDMLVDFDGAGDSPADFISLEGYGIEALGASFTNIAGTNQWIAHSADGLVNDIVTLLNGAAVHATDVLFV